MWKSFMRAVATRLVLVFTLTHLGALVLTYSAYRSSGSIVQMDPWFWGGLALIEVSFWMTLYFLFAPVRKVLNWRDWLVNDLPFWLSLIPAVLPLIQMIRTVFAAQTPAKRKEAGMNAAVTAFEIAERLQNRPHGRRPKKSAKKSAA
ncbi:MAG: hypothetical protein JNL01_09920 [Bdellovibrionales bacterium]|nr:hypothetical protein [Bdellovibrionales bacterium]